MSLSVRTKAVIMDNMCNIPSISPATPPKTKRKCPQAIRLKAIAAKVATKPTSPVSTSSPNPGKEPPPYREPPTYRESVPLDLSKPKNSVLLSRNESGCIDWQTEVIDSIFFSDGSLLSKDSEVVVSVCRDTLECLGLNLQMTWEISHLNLTEGETVSYRTLFRRISERIYNERYAWSRQNILIQ